MPEDKNCKLLQSSRSSDKKKKKKKKRSKATASTTPPENEGKYTFLVVEEVVAPGYHNVDITRYKKK